MIENELIAKFDESIDNSEDEWFSRLMETVRTSVYGDVDVEIIKKPVLGNTFTVTVTKDDWFFAIAKLESYYFDNTDVMAKLEKIKIKALEYYDCT